LNKFVNLYSLQHDVSQLTVIGPVHGQADMLLVPSDVLDLLRLKTFPI